MRILRVSGHRKITKLIEPLASMREISTLKIYQSYQRRLDIHQSDNTHEYKNAIGMRKYAIKL